MRFILLFNRVRIKVTKKNISGNTNTSKYFKHIFETIYNILIGFINFIKKALVIALIFHLKEKTIFTHYF